MLYTRQDRRGITAANRPRIGRLHVALDTGGQCLGEVRVIDDHCIFGVPRVATGVEIMRANHADAVIDHHRLGVQAHTQAGGFQAHWQAARGCEGGGPPSLTTGLTAQTALGQPPCQPVGLDGGNRRINVGLGIHIGCGIRAGGHVGIKISIGIQPQAGTGCAQLKGCIGREWFEFVDLKAEVAQVAAFVFVRHGIRQEGVGGGQTIGGNLHARWRGLLVQVAEQVLRGFG